MDAPLNAAEAASQVAKIWGDLYEARTAAEKAAKAAASLDNVYRTAKSRALLDPSLDGANQAQRDAAAHEWPASAAHRDRADLLATSVGMAGTAPETVGDLRWLAKRVEAMADASSARAYDERGRLQAWMTVMSMAKAEAEMAPPERMAA